jgi:hypothetical protein
MIGPRKNRIILACVGDTYSFNKSLSASANACRRPYQPTEFGPNLLCILAIVFLSATVTKATINKAGTITINTSRIDIIVGKNNIIFKIKLNIKLYIYILFF